MTRAAHDRSALAEFQNGEERLVYARHKAAPDEPLYYLWDDTAREVRAWAKEHLECFMPECSQRQLTTVARSARRDGFTHMRGAGGHAKEGLFHQQAKALIARWVTEKYQGEVIARPEQATTSRKSRADVMLTWPNGRQVAVEVQYAGMTPEKWRERHEAYAEHGIPCVWLLGHIPPHLREARDVRATSAGAGGTVAFGALHEAMLDAGVPLLWVNPIDEQIGSVWIDTDAHECEDYPCEFESDERRFQIAPQDKQQSSRTYGFFGLDALADCDLTPDGLHTPTTRRLHTEHAEYLIARKADYDGQASIREARERRHAQEQHELEVRQRIAKARTERMHDEDDRVRDYLQQEAPELAAHWANSPTHARLMAQHGAIPTLLSTALPNDKGVRGLAPHWHSVLYQAHVLGHPDGAKFTISDCYKTLTSNGFTLHPEGFRRATAIIDFLKHLAAADLVYLKMHTFRPGQVEYVRVYGDLHTAAENKTKREAARVARAAEQAEQQRIRVARRAEIAERRRAVEARQRAEAHRLNTARRPEPESPGPGPAVPPSEPQPAATGPRYTHCITCRLKLADIFMARGYHIGCEPTA